MLCFATKGYILFLLKAIILTSKKLKAKIDLLVKSIFKSNYLIRIKAYIYSFSIIKDLLLANLSLFLLCYIELCIKLVLKLSFFW
jgi:hypothetical protein